MPVFLSDGFGMRAASLANGACAGGSIRLFPAFLPTSDQGGRGRSEGERPQGMSLWFCRAPRCRLRSHFGMTGRLWALLAPPLPSAGSTLRGRAMGGRLRKRGERCGAVGMPDDGTTPSASPISLRAATRPSDLFPFSTCAPAPARRGAGAAGLGDDASRRPVAVRAAGLTRGARRRWPRREGVRAGSCRAIRRPA